MCGEDETQEVGTLGKGVIYRYGGLPCPDAILQASRGVEGGENQDGGAWGRMEE